MKWIKFIIIAIFIISGLYLFRSNSKKINLEGNWKVSKIILKGKIIYPSNSLDTLISIEPELIIDGWTKRLNCSMFSNKVNASYIILGNSKAHNAIKLLSKSSPLNGIFKLTIDTIHIGPQTYRVNVKLQSGSTLLDFYRERIIPPWKPEFPKRGRV